MSYRKRQKFGMILVWRIKGIRQTLIHQLVTFILFTIGCTVNWPNFLLPTFFETADYMQAHSITAAEVSGYDNFTTPREWSTR